MVIFSENEIFMRKFVESFVIRNSNTFNNNKTSVDIFDFISKSFKLNPKYKKAIKLR